MFLNESPDKIFKETGARLHLGVFGKHPAWDDHMEDVGLATPSLVEFKNRLYLGGVSGCIDTGVWAKLDAESRIDSFDHELIWSGEAGVIFAVLWNSSDGRGRREYPMVAAAHFPTARLPARVEPVFSALHQVAAACRDARDRDGVRMAQAAGMEALVSAARALVPLSAATWDIEERRAFADQPCFGDDRSGLHRLFYAMRVATETDSPCLHFRPACAGEDSEPLLIWQVLLRSQIKPSDLLLTMRHRGSPWLDAIQGDLTTPDWSRLKTTSSETPITTEIPYEIDEDLCRCAEMVIDSFIDNPERIPRLDGCGAEGPGQGFVGSLLSRFFRHSGSSD